MEPKQIMDANELRKRIKIDVDELNKSLEPKRIITRERLKKALDKQIERSLITLYDHTKGCILTYQKLTPFEFPDYLRRLIGPISPLMTRQDLEDVCQKYELKGYGFEIEDQGEKQMLIICF